MYRASDGVRYLVVPFGLAQATFFGANVKRFLLRSVIPTRLLVPAYTFFSLIAVHRMALLWCMEYGDNLVHPPLPIQRERASRVLHNCCGVLCFPLHQWLATREKHFTHNHNPRKKWCYTSRIYMDQENGHHFRLFRFVLKIGHYLPPWCKRENCIASLQVRPVVRWIFFIVRICIFRLKTPDHWLQIIIISEISNSKEALENITCATESTRKKLKDTLVLKLITTRHLKSSQSETKKYVF